MSGIIFENKCANCGREPLAVGIPVLQNPAAEGKGEGGFKINVWCPDCFKMHLLHISSA
jgi:hypothetical protein